MTPADLDNIYLAALDSEHGVQVRTNSVEGLKQKLYRHRKELRDRTGNTSFDHLKIKTSPTSPDDCVWLINPGTSDAS